MGNLQFLGRVDEQIKMRSYRIEPAEIEAALRAHPLVRQAVVIPQPSARAAKYLAAYVAGDPAEMPAAAELREHLKRKLPGYMVPAAFVMLPQLPLTANGKIDRVALPPPQIGDRSTYLAPQTETERKIAEIWRQTFQRSEIGLRDSFFEMGGHSLLAVRLVTQINDLFCSDLDAITFLQHPTVETLARAVDARSEGDTDRLIPICSGDERWPIVFLNTPFDFIQLATQSDGRAVYASQVPWSEETLRASARLDSSVFPSVEQMAVPHVELILKNRTIDSCILAGYSYGGVLAFEVAHQLIARGIFVEAVVLFDCDLKLPRWERMKRRLRYHSRHALRGGPAYIWRTLSRRRTRQRMHQAAQQSLLTAAQPNDLSDAEVRWGAIDRIWRHALRLYQPRRLPSHGVLLRAEETTYQPSQDFDGALGWSRRFVGGLEMIRVPGDHHSMWKEPHVHALSYFWKSSLNKIRRRAQSGA